MLRAWGFRLASFLFEFLNLFVYVVVWCDFDLFGSVSWISFANV